MRDRDVGVGFKKWPQVGEGCERAREGQHDSEHGEHNVAPPEGARRFLTLDWRLAAEVRKTDPLPYQRRHCNGREHQNTPRHPMMPPR